MVALASLWLPIVAAAAAVFVASSLVWMVLPYHKSDWKTVADEEPFMALLRAQKLGGGQYLLPGCKPEKMKDPEVKARFERGPWATLIVPGGKPNMGRSLGLWFAFLLLVGVVTAYVAGLLLPAGAPFQQVFRVVSAMTWLMFAGGWLVGPIWEGKPGSVALKGAVDGLIYALVVGAVFASLWPHAA